MFLPPPTKLVKIRITFSNEFENIYEIVAKGFSCDIQLFMHALMFQNVENL